MCSRVLHVISGGAEGADFEWLQCAGPHAATCSVWSFRGHSPCIPPGLLKTVEILEVSDTSLIDPLLEIAADNLGKTLPSVGNFVHNLLRRNAAIALVAETLIAIGHLKKTKNKNKNKQPWEAGVDGGTGWTCQLFVNNILMNKANAKVDVALPIFVCDNGVWHQGFYRYTTDCLEWCKCEPPALKGKCALIGSRKLSGVDKAAIHNLVMDIADNAAAAAAAAVVVEPPQMAASPPSPEPELSVPGCSSSIAGRCSSTNEEVVMLTQASEGKSVLVSAEAGADLAVVATLAQQPRSVVSFDLLLHIARTMPRTRWQN